MSIRVYLAAGVDGVRALRDTGEVKAPMFAVTPAMRAADPRADEEDLEYEASLSAEQALRDAGAPVVVIAADVAAEDVPSTDDPANADRAVASAATVPLSAVVSFHVAEHDAGADEELLWYDVTELDDVAAYLAL